MSAAAGAIGFGEFALADCAVLGPVPDDDFEEPDGLQIYFPCVEDEDVAAEWFGDEGDAHWAASAESILPLRNAPSVLPLCYDRFRPMRGTVAGAH